MKPTYAVVAAIVLASAAWLAACGVARTTTGTGSAGTPAACPTPTSAAARGAGRGSLAHALPVTTLPPAVTPGQVRVEVQYIGSGPCGAIAIPADDPIILYAGNGLGQSIFAADHRTGCSIVTLERRVGAAWRPVAICRLDSPTRLVEITPMKAAFVRIEPDAGAPWPAGTYRTAFAYHVGSANSSATDTVVYSSPFTVAA